MNIEKINQIVELCNIPYNGGQQFIHANLRLGTESGNICYGFDYKSQNGTLEFKTLDEAIAKITNLRQKAKL